MKVTVLVETSLWRHDFESFRANLVLFQMRPLVNAGGVVVGSATAEDLAKITRSILNDDVQLSNEEETEGTESDQNSGKAVTNIPSVAVGDSSVPNSSENIQSEKEINETDKADVKQNNDNVESLPSVDSVSLVTAEPATSENLFNATDVNIKKEIGADENNETASVCDVIDSKCRTEDTPDDSENSKEVSKSNLEMVTDSQDAEKDIQLQVGPKTEQNSDMVNASVCEGDPTETPVMVHQASQTDLEECVEDSDGLRFLSIPQKPPVTTPVPVSKPALVTSKMLVSKTTVAPPRVGVRTTPVVPGARPQATVRPAYAVVSRLSSPATSRTPASPVSPKPHTSPRLVRSRTSTDVRPAGRGTIRKLPVESPSSVLKSQRPAAPSRLVTICISNPVS